MFWFKKSKIVIDCFAYRSDVFDNCKIDYASKFFPDWWKKLPKEVYTDDKFTPSPTMKTCSGLLDLYKGGMIAPMWTELWVDLDTTDNDLYRWQHADTTTDASPHKTFQHAYDPKLFTHLKIEGPWRFECNADINWLWIQPTYNMRALDSYKVLPGVINLKRVPYLNINILFPRGDKPKRVVIDYKQPLVHIIPVSDKDLDIRHHLVSKEEFRRKLFHRSHFIGSYEKQRKEQKCPFSG